MFRSAGERTPAMKLLIAILVAAALAIPIFMVWFLVYDRQSQSQQAQASITAGWGGPQAIAGPVLVVPYRASATETVVENGQSVTRRSPGRKSPTKLGCGHGEVTVQLVSPACGARLSAPLPRTS